MIGAVLGSVVGVAVLALLALLLARHRRNTKQNHDETEGREMADIDVEVVC